MSTSFAYIHCKPDGTPFYVGKGALRRVKRLGERNQHHTAVVEKYGRANILIGKLECSSDEIAFQLEKGIIKCFKYAGIKLCNYTAGGDGGLSPIPETRKKLSEAAKKRGISEACKKAKIEALKGKSLSEEHKELLRIRQTGKVFSEEHRKNISISAKKRGMGKVHAALALKRAIAKGLV
jgi:hypothetical protein